MEILKICAVGVVAAVLSLTVKQYKPEFAVIISTCAAIIIVLMVADYLFDAVTVLKNLTEKSGIDSGLLSSVLKIIGIGYIAEFSAGVCEDAGNKNLADKLAFGGKVIILMVSLPVLTAVVEVITDLIV